MERQQLLKVMVPVGVFALVLILVGVVIALNTGSTPSSAAAAAVTPPDGASTDKSAPAPTAGRFEFPLDGPEWKDLGGGLMLWDVKEGTGDVCPTLTDKPGVIPIMHYTGWLMNHKQFDSSRPRGKPLDLPLKDLVAGWKQGVPGMKVGGVRRLIIPPELGYGPQGKPGIPPNSSLVFEMELIGVR